MKQDKTRIIKDEIFIKVIIKVVHQRQMDICCFQLIFFGIFCPTPEFFTLMETSPLPVKGSKL